MPFPSQIPLPVQGEGERARRARVRAVATSSSRSTPCVRTGFVPKLLSRLGRATLLSSAHHSDSSGLARSLALSFSRVAAARRIPVLAHVLPRNSAARARHARGNDRKIRPSGRACHYLVQDSIGNAAPQPVTGSPATRINSLMPSSVTTSGSHPSTARVCVRSASVS